MFDIGCCKLKWNPKLDDPFSENSRKLLEECTSGTTYYNLSVNNSIERYLKYLWRGFKITLVKVNVQKGLKRIISKNCVYVSKVVGGINNPISYYYGDCTVEQQLKIIRRSFGITIDDIPLKDGLFTWKHLGDQIDFGGMVVKL